MFLFLNFMVFPWLYLSLMSHLEKKHGNERGNYFKKIFILFTRSGRVDQVLLSLLFAVFNSNTTGLYLYNSSKGNSYVNLIRNVLPVCVGQIVGMILSQIIDVVKTTVFVCK